MLGDGFVLLAPPGTPPQLLATWATGEDRTADTEVAMLDKEDATAVEPPVIAARDLRGDLARLLESCRRDFICCVRTVTSPRFSRR